MKKPRRGSPRGFGEQENIAKISEGTSEYETIFREQGNKLYKLVDENMVSKLIKRGKIGKTCGNVGT